MKAIRGHVDVLRESDLDDHSVREACFLDIRLKAKGRLETLPQRQVDAMQPTCYADYKNQLEQKRIWPTLGLEINDR
jgi:hypothetical protein